MLIKQSLVLQKLAVFLLFFCAVFSLFFLVGFNFQLFNKELYFYLSEIICSGPSREINCTPEFQPVAEFFRGSSKIELLQDYKIRFVSSSFGNFVGLFTGTDDFLTKVVIKIYVLKSLLVAIFLTYSLYLVQKFPFLRQFAAQLTICIFAFPYNFFGASSVYPAPIATIAMLPILLTLRIYGQQKIISPTLNSILALNFVFGCAAIMANRFETTAFCLVAVLVGFWHTNRQIVNKRRALTPLWLYVATLAGFIRFNVSLRSWSVNSIRGEAKVLSLETASSSRLSERIDLIYRSLSGEKSSNAADIALALASPSTFIDNSSRNVLNALSSSQFNNLLFKVILLIAFWVPLISLLSQKISLLLRTLWKNRHKPRLSIIEFTPALLVILLFPLIPFFARTIWFFQYAAPLLLVLLLATQSLRTNSKFLKTILGLGIFSNAVAFFIVVNKYGSLYFGSIELKSHFQIAIGLLLGTLILGTTRKILRSIDDFI